MLFVRKNKPVVQGLQSAVNTRCRNILISPVIGVIAVQIKAALSNVNMFAKHIARLTALQGYHLVIHPATTFIDVYSDHCRLVLLCFSV
jgi:hypothetical protein